MKKLILLSALVFLTACNLPTHKTNDSAKSETKIEKINTQNLTSERLDTTSGIGEVCGGFQKTKCHQGLSCIFDYDTVDGHGTCAKKVVNEQECENVYDPVCGLNNGRQKYNYFNECQMKRHGAELVNKGKCEVDENVAGNCEAQARGYSNCFDTTDAYEFDGKECVKKVVATCDDAAEIPFESQASCEEKCL